MEANEKLEIIEALNVLNKYRNFFYARTGREEKKIFNIVDSFLPLFYNEIFDDELSKLVAEKVAKVKKMNR